jgi:hypothetical protein
MLELESIKPIRDKKSIYEFLRYAKELEMHEWWNIVII